MMRLFPSICSVLLCSLFSLVLVGCDGGGSNDPGEDQGPGFDRAEMLTHIGNNLIIPSYQAFQGAVASLHDAGDAFLADPTAATLTSAQTALKEARLAWQDVAQYQFGPAETFALRGALNTYPTDTDQIGANMASGSYVLGSIDNIDASGFPALDYLLHGIGGAPEDIVPLYTTAPEAASRRQYLEDNLDFVQTNVDAVVEQWLPAGGNYIATFLSDENGGVDVGSSLGQMINAMILHYERFIRDGKIGIPAGVRSSGVPRPVATEAFYAGYSLELADRSMTALERLFTGTAYDGSAGPGLEENLQFLDASDLASDITGAMETIRTGLDGLTDPLSGHIESDTDAVVMTFTDMQSLVVLLKADMTSFLGITITFQDNDGD